MRRGELSALALPEVESIPPHVLYALTHFTLFLCFTSCDKFAVPGLWKAAGRVSCQHCFSPLYRSAGLDPFKSPFLFFIFFIFSVQLPTISAFWLTRGLKSAFPLPSASSCSNPSCPTALLSTGLWSSGMNTRVESCWHPTEPHTRNLTVKSFQGTLQPVLAPSCRQVRQVDAQHLSTQEDCRLRQGQSGSRAIPCHSCLS